MLSVPAIGFTTVTRPVELIDATLAGLIVQSAFAAPTKQSEGVYDAMYCSVGLVEGVTELSVIVAVAGEIVMPVHGIGGGFGLTASETPASLIERPLSGPASTPPGVSEKTWQYGSHGSLQVPASDARTKWLIL